MFSGRKNNTYQTSIGNVYVIVENPDEVENLQWKLPNPSHFTYTSIVQPILQAKVLYNPFYTVFV